MPNFSSRPLSANCFASAVLKGQSLQVAFAISFPAVSPKIRQSPVVPAKFVNFAEFVRTVRLVEKFRNFEFDFDFVPVPNFAAVVKFDFAPDFDFVYFEVDFVAAVEFRLDRASFVA